MLLPLLLQLAPPVFEPAPTPDEQEVVTAQIDALRRLTVAVTVNDAGPYRFLIDTGAERTVVSDIVAARVAGPRTPATLIHMAGRTAVEVVRVRRLALGRSVYPNLDAPILARRTMGMDGVLGADALQEQRILFDFAGGTVTLISPREVASAAEGIVIRARRRSGRLILTTARIGTIDVDVVIDTGAQRSVANPALAAAFNRRRSGTMGELTSITGDTIATRLVAIERLSVGPLEFDDFVISVTDSPAFVGLKLARRPAIMLGMDALGQFARVLIDFPGRRVEFELAKGRR